MNSLDIVIPSEGWRRTGPGATADADWDGPSRLTSIESFSINGCPMHLEAYEVVYTESSDGGALQCAAHDEFSVEIDSLRDVHCTTYETIVIEGRDYIVAMLPQGQ